MCKSVCPGAPTGRQRPFLARSLRFFRFLPDWCRPLTGSARILSFQGPSGNRRSPRFRKPCREASFVGKVENGVEPPEGGLRMKDQNLRRCVAAFAFMLLGLSSGGGTRIGAQAIAVVASPGTPAQASDLNCVNPAGPGRSRSGKVGRLGAAPLSRSSVRNPSRRALLTRPDRRLDAAGGPSC